MAKYIDKDKLIEFLQEREHRNGVISLTAESLDQGIRAETRRDTYHIVLERVNNGYFDLNEED